MIKLLKGNCLDLLRQLEPGCADLVLIDPPYSSGGLFAGDRKQDTRVKYTDAGFNGAARFPSFSGDNMDQHSFIQFMAHVSMELRELTKEGGTIAAFIDWRNLPAMTDAIQMAGWVWRGIIVWDKGISRNIPGRFRNDCEYIVWGTNGRKEVDWKAAKGAKAMPGIYHINGVNTKQKHHQTEKPVELLKALIQICPRGGPWWTASWDPAARASLASRRAGTSSASNWATNTSRRPPSASRRPRRSFSTTFRKSANIANQNVLYW